MKNSLKELHRSSYGNNAHYWSVPGRHDANKGHGYGTLDQKMKPRPSSSDGFPYDLYDLDEPDESWEDDFEIDFVNVNTLDTFNAKTNNVRSSQDPNAKRDPFTYFDDNVTGLHGESLLRKYIQTILKESPAIRLRSRSAEPDGAVTQWGWRQAGGTQFGWSSAYPFDDKESREPVFSLKDLMMKHEDDWDRMRGEITHKENDLEKEEFIEDSEENNEYNDF